MASGSQPTILVIVGISGDLARRKLLPAIQAIAKAGELPEDFRIVGVTRRELKASDVLDKGSELAQCLKMYQMDLADPADYKKLAAYLGDLESNFSAAAQRLFYLSVPPQVSQPIIENMGNAERARGTQTKLLLEKPFGTDLASAEDLVDHTKKFFDEEQVYRIDHYLAKEMAQNILVFRSSNSLFRHTWNKDFIDRIDIIASEKIGIEGRAVFYEQTGALRDIVQSHLLQLAALTLMEMPAYGDWTNVPKKRAAALRSLQLAGDARRGQYRGYSEEVQNPGSTTETFTALTLESRDPRWEGVQFRLATGKALKEKSTEIRIHYKQEDAREANQLVLRVQPREGVEVALWAKRPGYERQLEHVPLRFTYEDHFTALPDAYEQVLLDAIRSDHSLFTSNDEVLAAWKIIAPIQHTWSMHSDDLLLYDEGTSIENLLQ
ncbi:MAG: glucose-6-phosphate dehydrogenase [Candidatus Saccharimonadales bacterium]